MLTWIDSPCRVRPGWPAVVVFVLLAMWLPSLSAMAQGTSGTLPDPISDSELSAYARRLGLSDQQRLAIDSYHQDYLEEFRRLREREIEAYLEESQDVMRMFFRAPDADEVRSRLRELDQLMGRIRTLDEKLFSRIQSLLSEEQAPQMQRVRQMRERARHRTGLVRFVGFSNPGARVDLSALTEKIDLSPQDRQAMEPLLVNYERQLTAASRKTYEAATSMIVETAKEMEQLEAMSPPSGRGEDDRRRMRNLFRTMREIWSEAAKEVMSEAAEISQLNRRSHSGFTALLSAEGARRLTDGYYEAAYPAVLRGMVSVLGKYKAALDLPGLGEEQRTRLEAAREDLERRHTTLAEKMIDLIEETRGAGGFFVFRERGDDPAREKLRALEAQRDELNAQAIEMLAAILGPDLRAELDRPNTAGDGEEASVQTATVSVVVAGGGDGPSGGDIQTMTVEFSDDGDEADAYAAGPDPYLPGPISPAEIESYGMRLRLTEDERSIVDSLYLDYTEAWETLREGEIQAVLDLQQAMWSLDAETGEIRPPSSEQIDQLFALRRAALEAILALDGTLLENMELVLVGEDDEARTRAMERVRLARKRVVYNRGEEVGGGMAFLGRGGPGRRGPGGRPNRGGGGGNTAPRRFNPFGMDNKEGSIDLARIVDAMQLPTEPMEAIGPELVAYEQEIAEAFHRRYELTLTHAQAMARLEAGMLAQRELGPRSGGPPPLGEEMRELMKTSGRQLGDFEQDIVRLNRTSLEGLIGSLPVETGQALRRAYRRQAFPGVYRDPGAAEPHLVRALALEDLTESQRGQINDTLTDYREPYHALCESMVDLHVQTAAARESMERGPEMWEAMRERRNEIEKLRFDRNELNEKTLRRLRAVLTEEQIQRLGLVESG